MSPTPKEGTTTVKKMRRLDMAKGTGIVARIGVALAAAWMALGGTTACGSQRDPIVQVQVGYIKKSDLVGQNPASPTEWYLRNTVIDVRRTNSFAFPGMQDAMKRVRFDIQQNFLLVRRSYELVSGSDGKGATTVDKNGNKIGANDGVIVAMYPITKHFDIKYDYDTTTGENHNILVENDTDRLWYERDYIRVDWSKNLATDPDMEELWIPKIFGELTLQPVQYYETEPNSPNAPVMDTEHGYFDVTAKYVAQYEQLLLGDPRDPFAIPACLLTNLFTGSETYDCNDQEFTIRQSFMKVPDHDYEPAETSGDKYTMFGTFTRTRYGFDRGYGVTDRNFHQYMARHNIWQKSHDARTCGGPNADKAAQDAKCGTVAGSVCDMTSEKCTVPYEDRPIRTVPYFLDATMPDDADIEKANVALVGEWNDAMKTAVATAREVECRDTKGGDAGACHAKWFDASDAPKLGQEVVVLCHNPVRAGDDKACSDGMPVGADGQIRAREGDLRFNLIGWVNAPISIGLLGYGPDGADPLTGEVVQATAYIYGGALDYYAAQTRDIVAMANGDLAADGFAQGKAAVDNLGTFTPNSKLADPDVFAQYGDYLKGNLDRPQFQPLTDADIHARLSGIDASKFVAALGAKAAIDPSASAGQRLATVNALIADAGVKGVPGFGGAAEAKAQLASYATRLAGTETEQQIIDDRQYVLENSLLDSADAKKMGKAVSPFGKYGWMGIAQMQDAYRQHLELNGQCLFGADEFNAPNVTGLANKLKNLYNFTADTGIPADCKQPADPSDSAQFDEAARLCRQKKVFTWLRATIYKAVTEHEVGHTMSLRHNFQGSWDAINYHPNYWKLRTADGAHTNKICTTARDATRPDSCMGPRWLDPMTDAEMGKTAGQPGIDEFQYSSIMDYGYDFNSDLHGLGLYDKAAMKFIYTGVVETMTDAVPANTQDHLAPIHNSPLTEQWMVKSSDGKTVSPIHYTKLAQMMGLFDAARCTDSTGDDAVGGQTCAPPPKGHAFIRDMDSGEVSAGYWAPYWKQHNTGAVRWPYRFGSDEYASYPQGLRFDAGADVYEASQQLLNLYEYRYVLDFYRRGRRGWFPQLDFFGRLWGRYFSRFHSLGWLTALRVSQASAMYPGTTPDTNPALQSDDWGKGYALAATVLFEGLERSALRPQPGPYAVKQADPGESKTLWESPDFPQGTEQWKIGVLDGRYVDEMFDNDVGGSFYYLSYLQRMGTYMEKPLAAIALNASWPVEEVVSRDRYLDPRNVLLNYRSILPQAYDRLYAGLLGEDWDTVAPYVNQSKKDKTTKVLTDGVHFTPLWQTDVTRPGNATLIDPLVGYKMQGASIVYGLYFGTWDGEQSLPDSMRIWVEGGPEGIVVPASEKIILVEPESGTTWAAHKLGTDTIDGKTVERGIGARMLIHANQLLAAAYKVETDAATGLLPVYTVDGKLVWQKGVAPGTITDDASLARFRKFIGVLNVERTAMWNLGIR